MSKIRKYLLDTNVFLRLFVREDERSYQVSTEILQACRSGKIKGITHDLVLAELVWTLNFRYKQPKAETVNLVNGVMNLRGVEMISGFDRYLALDHYKNYSVKYVDACLASIDQVRKHEWAIVSYDKDFKKLPVIWMLPEEVSV